MEKLDMQVIFTAFLFLANHNNTVSA